MGAAVGAAAPDVLLCAWVGLGQCVATLWAEKYPTSIRASVHPCMRALRPTHCAVLCCAVQASVEGFLEELVVRRELAGESSGPGPGRQLCLFHAQQPLAGSSILRPPPAVMPLRLPL